MKPMHILIIDDDPDDRYLLARQLRQTGLNIEIIELEEGQAALDYFTGRSEKMSANSFPELMFLDINMPGVSGLQFLEKFKAIRDDLDVTSSVVIMFTSSEEQKDVDKSLSYEFVREHLVKGQFSSDELKDKIKSVAGKDVESI